MANNNNNYKNHSSQPQVTGLNFLENEWQQQLTNSLVAFHDNVNSYQNLKQIDSVIKCQTIAYYIHLEENNSKANSFYQIKDGKISMKRNLHCINCICKEQDFDLKKDLIRMCIEYESKKIVKKSQNAKADELEDSILNHETHKPATNVTYNQALYLMFMNNNQIVCGLNRLKLEADYRYFGVFASVPTKAVFKVIPF